MFKSTVDGRRSTVDRLSGFTLIELIIIIVVVSVGIASLVTAVGSVVHNTITPNIIQIATELAEQELEKISGQRYSFVCSCNNNPYAAPFASYSREILVSPVPAGLAADAGMVNYKQVEVRVSHNIIGNVSLRTVVTNSSGGVLPVACGPAVPCS